MDYREDEDKFKELLNQEYTWPAQYTFKFIVAADQEEAVKSLFNNEVEITRKLSSGGKYVSTTVYARMNNAEEIMTVYEAAANISGIISL
jgi:uncharacterized protein